MTTQMIICFIISAIVIAGYIWNKLSVGTVGCIGIVLFLLTGCIGPKDILGNIGNANLVMITSMFVISEGFKRTKAIHLVASTVKKISKGSMVMVMLGFTLATVMAATFTGSAVAAFCIVAPIVTATCEEMNISISKTIFSVGLVSIAACAIIPVGGSLAMLAELNGYIAANGYEQYTMEAMDLFKGRGMSLLVLMLYTTFVGFRFAPEKPIVASKDSSELSKRVAHHEPLKQPQEIAAIAIFCLVSLCLIFNTPLNNVLAAIGGPNLAAWEISFIGAVATVATGVLSSKEACASMPDRSDPDGRWRPVHGFCASKHRCRRSDRQRYRKYGIQPWQSLPHWRTVLSDPLLPDPDHAEPYRYGDFCSHRDSGLQEHGRRLHRPSAAGRLCLLHRFHDPDGNAYRSYGYGHRRL
mgnify:CR=1 FL=1